MRVARQLSPRVWPAVLALLAGLVWLGVWSAKAGGPLYVGGPGFGVEGQPFIWDPAAMPVQYRVDGGPLSQKPDGTIVIDNAAGVTRVQNMFKVWQDVPTAAISYTNAGPMQPAGVFTDGDVNTVEEFDAVVGSCTDGLQNPIIFDADARIMQQLIGEPYVIGFAGICRGNATTGRFEAALALINGSFQDGIDDGYSNLELTAAEFNEAFAHEFGHLSGLDHSQINVNILYRTTEECSTADLAGLPLMFPFVACQARSTAGLPMLAPDDVAWISKLYPETVTGGSTQRRFDSVYGLIRGTILFSDGVTHAQGVNVIARDTTNSRKIAVSVVSGYLFTGNPGQSVTGTNDEGDPFGSRNPLLVGSYEIPVPAGSYWVQVESISAYFTGGSAVGPLSPPIPNPGPNEYWDINESATDNILEKSTIPVNAGAVVSGKSIILNNTKPRFDSLEGDGAWLREPVPAWGRDEGPVLNSVAA